ncbi:MAG: glycosyltransferase [Candidatus Limnocylindrales bacterium]
MLTNALVAAVIALGGTTLLLLAAGTRPLGWPVRWLGLLAAAPAAASSPEAVAAVVAIVAVALLLPRRWYAVGAWLFAALLATSALYGAYLVRASILLGNGPLSITLGLVLLALEIGAMGMLIASAFEMVDALCGPPLDPVLPGDPDQWPVVCLQVPTYNEPAALVIETIESLVALDYPALRVQVIDNNTTDERLWRPVEAACERLRGEGHGVDFVHLPTWPGFKAGALNWGMAHLDPAVEVVGVIDADYVVAPDWLRQTVPFFGEPAVAFVQTPQEYREWEGSAFYQACHTGFAYFFKVGMVSRAHRNAIIFAGTMGLMRRPVLDEVGGWDERIITEDAEISLRVLARGYRSVYVPRAFGRGIMPLSYEALRKQRFRWAFGGIQILRRHRRTLLGRGSGLTLGQRYDHLVGGLWWFNDALTLGFAAFVGTAAAGAITGHPFIVQRLTGLGLVLPVAFLVLNLVRYLWGLGTTTGVGPALALAALRVNLSLSWVIALACFRGLTQERGVFLRTPKFATNRSIRELGVVWVEAILSAIGAVLVVLLVLRAGFSTAGVTLAILLGWSLLIYGSAVGYALGDPERAPVAEILREKARLEIVAPAVGRVARSRPARAAVATVVAILAVGVVIAQEASLPPVAELPFQQVPVGPIAREPTPQPTLGPSPETSAGASPGSSGATGSGSPNATPSPGRGSGGGPTGAPPSSTPAPTPHPSGPPGPAGSPSPAPTPTPAPTPARTPPVPVPTPTIAVHTPPPHPTPTPRRSP